MKKLTRKLLISVLSVALALVALGTQTFAWFAMNDTVDAKNMTVEVKSDQMFLLIQAGHVESSGVIQTSAKIEDDAVTPSAALLPVDHNVDSSSTNNTALNGMTQSGETYYYDSWYYMKSTNPANYIGSASTQYKIESGALDDYVLINEFSFTVAKGSNNLNDLMVKTITITGNSAVKVLVVGTDGSEGFAASGAGHNVLCNELTDSTVENVKIYIYWDGNEENVYTNNIASLQDTTVTVTFTGTTA